MGTKNNPSAYDCYADAEPDEPMFVLLGRDRHAAALVELWALMREKEGEDKEIVDEARTCAIAMADDARSRLKAVMTLDALAMFASTLIEEKKAPVEQEKAQDLAPGRKAWNAPFEEGEIVCAGLAGRPAKLVKIFGPDADERVRDKGLIQLPRAAAKVDVYLASLRRASPQEIEAYHEAGGT